jgi:hypothetical protein
MYSPTKTRRRFTAQQKAEAVELCLQEGLFCNAVAQRLGLPSSSLARWVRQARIDRGQSGPKDQGLLKPHGRPSSPSWNGAASKRPPIVCWGLKNTAARSFWSALSTLREMRPVRLKRTLGDPAGGEAIHLLPFGHSADEHPMGAGWAGSLRL